MVQIIIIMKKINSRQSVNKAVLAIFILSEICLINFLRRFVYLQLTSDDASEMVLANLLAQQNAVISKEWYYSTEIRFFNTNLIYSLCFKLFSGKNWHFIRLASMSAMHLIMIFSIWYLCKRMYHSESFSLAALAIMMPMSKEYYQITLKGAYYIPHITISFLGIALLMGVMDLKGLKRYTSLLLSILLAFLSCIGGARQFIVLYLPLLLCVMLLSAGVIKKDGFTKYRSTPYFRVTVASVLTLAAGTAGYLVNTNYLSKVYSFQQWDQIAYKVFDWNSLVAVFNGFLTTYGFVEDLIDAPHSISNLIAVAIMALTIMAVIYPMWYRASVTKEYRFLSAFYASAVFVYILLYTMTSMSYETRYNQPIAAFSYVLIAIWISECKLGDNNKLIVSLVSTGVCILAASLVYSSMLKSFREHNYSNELEDIVHAALAGDYHYGYGSFWRSNVLTELSDGRIDMQSWSDSGSNEDLSGIKDVNAVFQWLQIKKHEIEKPEGKVFMVFTANEFNSCVWKAELPEVKQIYSSDNYKVYGFENYEDMINTIGGYSFSFGSNLWSTNCYDKGNIRIMEPEGISYGPYMQFYEGDYSVDIRGKGLSGTNYRCSYDAGQQSFELDNVNSVDGHICFTFYCNDNFKDGEIYIRNDSQEEIEIDSIRIARIAAKN